MPKDLRFGVKAKQKLLKGVSVVADAVGSTLGPKANNVAIERPWGIPSVLHDGVSVAREVDLKDKFENIGAQLVKEAAQKTNENSGDGTTTATILTHAIVEEALKNIAAGSNAMILKRGIEKGKDAVLKNLKLMAHKVKSDDEIKQIATISAQNETIGNLIEKAIKKLGRKCIITVEEGGTEMELEYKEGMEFNKGFMSPYFQTNDKGEAVVKDPIILISDFKMNTMPEFVTFMRNWEALPGEVKSGNNMVIICEEAVGNIMATFIANKLKGTLNINVIGVPAYGDDRKDILEDIAVITGGKFVSIEKGDKIDALKPDVWGRASRVISTKDNTMIVDGKGKPGEIKFRVKKLKEQLNKADSEFDTEKLRERIAKLSTGIAIINVGASSEVEMRDKKERCIDAINATKAAVEEGIVVGGEIALLIASNINSEEMSEVKDEQTGIEIVNIACKKPFEILMSNSGYNPGQMLERIISRKKYFASIKKKENQYLKDNLGIDVIDGQIKDMFEAGIIDPVKVTKSALTNAVSVAIMIATTNSIITDIKEDNPQVQGQQGV